MEHRRKHRTPARPIVLVVDAHDETRALYALALSALGFDVVAAQDGDDAWRRVCEEHPDIIVTDLQLPNHDGWLDELKQDPHTRKIPVVAVVSGRVQPPVRKRAGRDGFAAFFPERVMPDELALGLREVLDAHVHQHAEH